MSLGGRLARSSARVPHFPLSSSQKNYRELEAKRGAAEAAIAKTEEEAAVHEAVLKKAAGVELPAYYAAPKRPVFSFDGPTTTIDG